MQYYRENIAQKEKICTAWDNAVDTCVGYINGGRRVPSWRPVRLVYNV